MLIGLIDIDGHNRKTLWGSAFPNLALMKIAAWHRAQGKTTRSARRDACQSKKLPKGEDVRYYCKLKL